MAEKLDKVAEIAKLQELARSASGFGLSNEFIDEMKKLQVAKSDNSAETDVVEGSGGDKKVEDKTIVETKSGGDILKIKVKTPGSDPNPIIAATQSKEMELEIKNFDDMTKAFESNFGLKSMEDVFNFISQAKVTLPSLEEYKKKAEIITGAIERLPEDLYALNSLFWNGQDYKPLLKSMQEFDYSLTSDKIPPETLVSKYFPNKVSSDDIQNNTPAYEALVEAAKMKYGVEKRLYDERISNANTIAQRKKEARQESLNKSAEKLKSSELFKNVPKDKIDELTQDLASNFFNDQFFMPDGSFKEDAVEKAAILKYGKDALSLSLKSAKADAAEAAKQDILKESRDKKQKPGGGSGAEGEVDQQKISKALDSLKGLNSNNIFEHIPREIKK